jgi:FO synthase subunit 2
LTLDSLLKGIDPLISSTLDRALSDKEISENQAVELFDSKGNEMNVIILVPMNCAGGLLEIMSRML